MEKRTNDGKMWKFDKVIKNLKRISNIEILSVYDDNFKQMDYGDIEPNLVKIVLKKNINLK